MSNEIYKQHGFFLTCVCVCCAFCNGFGNNDTSQKNMCLQTINFFHLCALHT